MLNGVMKQLCYEGWQFVAIVDSVPLGKLPRLRSERVAACAAPSNVAL